MHDMEMELESEFEFENAGLGEFENPYGETPLGEGPFGEGPLGEGPFGESPLGEFEHEQVLGFGESEWESEDELFFGKIWKGIKKAASVAAPILRKVAKVAAPMVGTAIGGPLGGKLGSLVGNALESEYEFEGPLGEYEYESESEAEFESVMAGPLTEAQGLGELMAAIAANAATDTEAEAQIGGAIMISLSPSDRDALRDVLPSLTRGAAVLTRVLRRHPSTRVVVRAVPTIVKRTAIQLKKRAANGEPVTKKGAARAMASQTRRVLATPSVCARAMQRNVKATQSVSRRNNGRSDRGRSGNGRQAFAW
ncbi:MAG TPA: hypothetical protein VGF69_22145 [Thermoanaerobaculia bacterium]|jgi:hypothetical protein